MELRALEAVESRFGVISSQQEQPTAAQDSSLEVQGVNTVLVSSEYRIEELHTSGGLGSVYIAIDPVLNRKVAIKLPRWKNLTSEQAARFEREARVTGRLDHPGIVPVHALKSDRTDRPCYVMRFVDGKTYRPGFNCCIPQPRRQRRHPSLSRTNFDSFCRTW